MLKGSSSHSSSATNVGIFDLPPRFNPLYHKNFHSRVPRACTERNRCIRILGPGGTRTPTIRNPGFPKAFRTPRNLRSQNREELKIPDSGHEVLRESRLAHNRKGVPFFCGNLHEPIGG